MANDEFQKMSLEQTQSQRMLPLQVRVGRLLEMNAIEVEEEVKRALDELPALEIAEQPTDDNIQNTADGESFNESAEQMQLADYKNDEEIPSLSFPNNISDSGSSSFEPVAIAPESTLMETLMRQTSELNITPVEEIIARHIIGNIDDNGYMSRDVNSISNDIAVQTGIDVSADDVRRIWKKVRTFDPPGIGAVDLRDCLLLQLKRKPSSQAVENAKEIIADYFDLFSKKHFDRITSIMSLSDQQLRDALAVIKLLNPKPGGQLETTGIEEQARHIIPDFSVETDGDNITLTLLNNLPELQIEQTFNEESPRSDISSRQRRDVQTFLRQHRDEAKEFIKILKTRQQTLFRVMSTIVKLQRDFFLTDDPGRIRPMILKDVAAITGDDLSVISRATASKYVATSRGIYPIKMFFNERTQTDDDTSSHRILASLKSVIEKENKQKPLSDEQITSILNQEGYSLARRTVAKYRERLGIPVARLRKEI